MGDILEFEKGNIALARRIQRDLDFNTKFKRKIERYWASLGHTVNVEVTFNPVNKVYLLRSDIKNGLPVDKHPTAMCQQKLLRFKVQSDW